MVLIDMEMPTVCVDDDWYGNCPLDRLWCAQRFAPKGYTMEKIVADQQDKLPNWCPLKRFTPSEPQITTNINNTEEIHHGCTVQVLRNSVTGDVSVGWWKEEGWVIPVRCRDCKWFGLAGCAIQIVDDTDKPSEDDFCSFGERKGGDE